MYSGWIQETREDGTIVVWLKKRGSLEAGKFETREYNTAQKWISDFVTDGSYPA